MPISIFLFLSAYLSVCLCLNLSFFPFLSCHRTVAVSCCCEYSGQYRCALGQRGWVHIFQWPSHRRPHLGAADWICGFKHSEAWSIHCEQQHSGPRPFNRRPQRFLFTSIGLSFTSFPHVAVRDTECGIIVCVCVFWCQAGRVGKKSGLPNQRFASSETAMLWLTVHKAFHCKSVWWNYLIQTFHTQFSSVRMYLFRHFIISFFSLLTLSFKGVWLCLHTSWLQTIWTVEEWSFSPP